MSTESLKGRDVYVLIILDNTKVTNVGNCTYYDFNHSASSNYTILDLYENENDAITEGFKMIERLHSEGRSVLAIPVKFTIK